MSTEEKVVQEAKMGALSYAKAWGSTFQAFGHLLSLQN